MNADAFNVAPRQSGAHAHRTPRGLAGVTIVAAGIYGATLIATEGEPYLVTVVIGALVGLAVFVRPIIGLYLLFAAAVVLEQFEITGLAPLTAQTHFFQNLSGFSNVPLRLSASDLLVIMTLASWGLRQLVGENPPTRVAPLGWAFLFYLLAFSFGAVVGIARGGSWDGITALAEGRGAIYAGLLYFLTANLVRDRGQVIVILWLFVVLVGVKALQGIGNYVEMRTSGPFWLEAVTAHEDVVFFDVALVLAVVAVALRVRGRLFYLLLAFVPVILLSELLTQRRVAFAALGLALVVVAFMTAHDRPRATAIALGVGAFAFVLYAAAFWDHHGTFGQPLRVVREIVDPNSMTDRDRLSNLWRDIENSNIAYTIRQLPLTGVGLGQEYLFQREPPPLTTFVYWRHIAHNAVLWVWLKAGPFGALAFWFLVGQALVAGLRLYRRLDDPLLRVTAAFPVLVVIVQIMFSSVDLGLTYNRTMIVFGVALGLTAQLAAWAAVAPTGERRATAAVGGPVVRLDRGPRAIPTGAASLTTFGNG